MLTRDGIGIIQMDEQAYTMLGVLPSPACARLAMIAGFMRPRMRLHDESRASARARGTIRVVSFDRTAPAAP